MRFLIGFVIGVAAGFVAGAVFAGEDQPLALLTGQPPAETLP